MRKPIVVGVDVQRDDHEPLAFAALLARAAGAPLIVVGAYLADPSPAHLVGPDHARRVRRETEERLALLVDAVAGVQVQARATPLSPARALHEIAEAEGAGLVVVGSTARGVLGRVVAGRITERTLHGSSCPVAVVPRRYEPPQDGLGRIGVAFADTPEGHEALRAGAALARATGARLHAVTVVQPVGDGYETAAAAQARALESISDVQATGEVLSDATVVGLLDASAAFDVLVCGSRGYGRVRTVLLGGVSDALAREARCPVIVVPRGEERELEELLATGVTSPPPHPAPAAP